MTEESKTINNTALNDAEIMMMEVELSGNVSIEDGGGGYCEGDRESHCDNGAEGVIYLTTQLWEEVPPLTVSMAELATLSREETVRDEFRD